MVEQRAQCPEHAAHHGSLACEVDLLYDEVLQHGVAGVVAEQHLVDAHAVASAAGGIEPNHSSPRSMAPRPYSTTSVTAARDPSTYSAFSPSAGSKPISRKRA